jgi:hypothetical protein
MEKKEDSGLLKKNSNSFVELFVEIQFSIFNLLIQNLRFQINCFIEFFLDEDPAVGRNRYSFLTLEKNSDILPDHHPHSIRLFLFLRSLNKMREVWSYIEDQRLATL